MPYRTTRSKSCLVNCEHLGSDQPGQARQVAPHASLNGPTVDRIFPHGPEQLRLQKRQRLPSVLILAISPQTLLGKRALPAFVGPGGGTEPNWGREQREGPRGINCTGFLGASSTVRSYRRWGLQGTCFPSQPILQLAGRPRLHLPTDDKLSCLSRAFPRCRS